LGSCLFFIVGRAIRCKSSSSCVSLHFPAGFPLLSLTRAAFHRLFDLVKDEVRITSIMCYLIYIGAEDLFRMLYFFYLYIMISTVFPHKVTLSFGKSRPDDLGSGGERKKVNLQESRFQRVKASVKKTSKKRFKKACKSE
jgi:hypothetical protein